MISGQTDTEAISLAKGTISLYVKFGLYPVWLGCIGFPHPPRTSAPSPKGRLTDTEAVSLAKGRPTDTETVNIYGYDKMRPSPDGSS